MCLDGRRKLFRRKNKVVFRRKNKVVFRQKKKVVFRRKNKVVFRRKNKVVFRRNIYTSFLILQTQQKWITLRLNTTPLRCKVNGGIPPRVLKTGTKRRWVVTFMHLTTLHMRSKILEPTGQEPRTATELVQTLWRRNSLACAGNLTMIYCPTSPQPCNYTYWAIQGPFWG
jgi:hypothetical protein